MTPDEPSDQALASRALAGDDAGFTALMRRHKPWLYAFVRRYVGTSDDAYDILQDAFVAAWKGLRSYDPGQSFPTWLRRIALNKCRDRARWRAVRGLFVEANHNFDHVAATARWSDPVATVETSHTLARLDRAIAALPRQLKEPLLLIVFEGLSQREAAAALGLSPKAVETRVHRAKQRLRDLLEPADIHTFAHEDQAR